MRENGNGFRCLRGIVRYSLLELFSRFSWLAFLLLLDVFCFVFGINQTFIQKGSYSGSFRPATRADLG